MTIEPGGRVCGLGRAGARTGRGSCVFKGPKVCVCMWTPYM